MNVLVIGGSGYVGELVLPTLARTHTLRVLDLRPPVYEGVEFLSGSVTDTEVLPRACEGMDALLYLAMGTQQDWGSPACAASAFDVNVKGLYLSLRSAAEAGLERAVYSSSMSVYHAPETRYFPDEAISPDALDFYGFTKGLGELVCQHAARVWGLSVNALRLCLPQEDERWLAETHASTPTIATSASDVASAFLAALAFRGGGFEAFMVSGDYEQKLMNLSKAKRLLGWSPQARPRH